MKIEQLIVQHLYNSKKVTLQDIGTFTLSPNVAMSFENDKDSSMPENAVSFNFNNKATQDDDLISFIVSHTRKIKPLATSDLESYTILAKQFLNIGKPFPIEGLGVLQKTQSGEYEFFQGNSVNARLEAAPALLKEKTEEDISFSTKEKIQPGKKWIWFLLLVLFSGLSTYLYYFLNKENKNKHSEKINKSITDTISKPKDTLARSPISIPDTIVAHQINSKNEDYTFKIVIKEYKTKEAAEKAFAKYTTYGHKLLLYSKDSSFYKIAIPFTGPISDTLRAKDSLSHFFDTRAYLEKN